MKERRKRNLDRLAANNQDTIKQGNQTPQTLSNQITKINNESFNSNQKGKPKKKKFCQTKKKKEKNKEKKRKRSYAHDF